MHFSPRQADILAAICRLQENAQVDPNLERLEKETGLKPTHISRIIAGIKDREKILDREIHSRKVAFFLNPSTIATTGLVARILLKLRLASRSDHVKLNEFKKSIQESRFFKESGKGEEYLDRLFKWVLLPEVGYAYIANESPDFIGASPRVIEEIEYLNRIAVPDE